MSETAQSYEAFVRHAIRYLSSGAVLSYVEATAEAVRLQEKEARLFALERWRAHQAKEAARAEEKAPAGELPACGSFWG